MNKFHHHLIFSLCFGLVCTASFLLVMSLGSPSIRMFVGVLHSIPAALTSTRCGNAQGDRIGMVMGLLLIFCQWFIVGFGLSLGLRFVKSK